MGDLILILGSRVDYRRSDFEEGKEMREQPNVIALNLIVDSNTRFLLDGFAISGNTSIHGTIELTKGRIPPIKIEIGKWKAELEIHKIPREPRYYEGGHKVKIYDFISRRKKNENI